MNSTLFRQSDVADPYAIYRERSLEDAIHWDPGSDCWAVYSYEACVQLLMHPSALIPPSPGGELDMYAQMIKSRLVRLQNPPVHKDTKTATSSLFHDLRSPNWPALLQRLLPDPSSNETIDWVEQVARRLPVIGILESLGFDWKCRQRILEAMPGLIKIMQPAVLPDDAMEINLSAFIVGRSLEQRLPADAVGPVAGLLIQSYDAGRGLLSNALLHACSKGPQQDWQAFVTEVLRYDPPVHHTRRVAGEDMTIQNSIIKRGDKILLVLAAANRDEQHFKNASAFDPGRSNNEDQLSFGAGPHTCMAASFAVTMAATCLEYLFKTYGDIQIIDQQLTYEPLFNIRSLFKLLIRLTK